MSNIIEYKDIVAFHPGCYIAEIVEDMEISQAEFAMRLGTTPKTISKLINGQCNLSNDLAQKLSMMLGTGIEVWLNLQTSYEKQMFEIEKEKSFDAQNEIVRLMDYSYFVNNAKLPQTRKASEKIEHLCSYFKIANLNILKQPDFLVNYRTAIASLDIKNIVNAQAWLQTAINFANMSNVKEFNADKLKESLPKIRSMTIQRAEVFLPRLKEIFAECGVAFVLLPHLKNSGINGAVKWFSPNKVMLAINDRRTYADTFWFSLFHEIKHVLQQKYKTTFISGNAKDAQEMDLKFEQEADEFAMNYLIPMKYYKKISGNPYISDEEICSFAEEIGIHPRIVAGRLQHDGVIPQYRCSQLKGKYKITVE